MASATLYWNLKTVRTFRWRSSPETLPRTRARSFSFVHTPFCLNNCIGFILYETKSKHKEILFTDAVRRKLDFCVEAIQRDAAKALVPQTSASDAQCTQCEFMNFCADRL